MLQIATSRSSHRGDSRAPIATPRSPPSTRLYTPLEAARFAAGELEPFVPGVARIIADRLGHAELTPTWGVLTAGAELRLGPPPLPRTRR